MQTAGTVSLSGASAGCVVELIAQLLRNGLL